MHIFARAKCGSRSIFKCDHSAPIFKVIGHGLSELREFYNMSPKNGNIRLAPSVPQIAVKELSFKKRHVKSW